MFTTANNKKNTPLLSTVPSISPPTLKPHTRTLLEMAGSMNAAASNRQLDTTNNNMCKGVVGGGANMLTSLLESISLNNNNNQNSGSASSDATLADDNMSKCYENLIVIDAGANLTNKKYSRDLDSVVQRAKDAGKWRMTNGYAIGTRCVSVRVCIWVFVGLQLEHY